MTCNILRLPEVMKITGLSRSSIYAMIDKEAFPKQIALGERAVGWLSSEVHKWISDRLNERG